MIAIEIGLLIYFALETLVIIWFFYLLFSGKLVEEEERKEKAEYERLKAKYGNREVEENGY